MMKRKSIWIWFLMASCLLTPCVAYSAGWQWMAPQRLSNLVKEGSGLWLVDVRSEAAFEEGHIEGAMHMPSAVLTTRQLPKGKIVVLVDDGLGLRSAREAAEALLKNGNDKVFLLEGGMVAWRGEGYPVAGNGYGRTFRGVMPEDVSWARENRIPMRIFDLRNKGEQLKGPVPQALGVEGKDLRGRLEKVKSILTIERKKGLTARLERSVVVILVFPTGIDPQPLLDTEYLGVPGDIRFLEGGYAAWNAKPDKKVTVSEGACPSCPKGVPGGTK